MLLLKVYSAEFLALDWMRTSGLADLHRIINSPDEQPFEELGKSGIPCQPCP